jgi:hypothetical protein
MFVLSLYFWFSSFRPYYSSSYDSNRVSRCSLDTACVSPSLVTEFLYGPQWTPSHVLKSFHPLWGMYTGLLWTTPWCVWLHNPHFSLQNTFASTWVIVLRIFYYVWMFLLVQPPNLVCTACVLRLMSSPFQFRVWCRACAYAHDAQFCCKRVPLSSFMGRIRDIWCILYPVTSRFSSFYKNGQTHRPLVVAHRRHSTLQVAQLHRRSYTLSIK